MRLAFYLGHYPSPGGTTTAVQGLTQALARAGHDVAIVCQGRSEAARSEGLVTILRYARPRPGAPFLVSRRLLAHLASANARYDLVVLNGIFHRDLPPIALALRRAKMPYVLAPHDPYHPALFRERRVWKEMYWRLFERPLLCSAAAIQVLATTHRQHLLARGVLRPSIEAPNGIEIRGSVPEPRNRKGLTVGVLGRMDAWNKGLDLLVQAVARLRADGSPARLVLQGRDQRDRDKLTKLADRLGIQEAVHFLEPAQDPVRAVAAYDILVIASRFEGFGLTALEAMVAGTPVLCSSEAGVAEHVRRAGCGLVVEPSVDGLAEGLLRLAARRADWPAMASAGRSYVVRELQWDRIANRVADQYRMVLAGLDPVERTDVPRGESNGA